MKRMTLIAVALCFIMLATVGAGVIAAEAAPAASQKVAQFDVIYNDKVVGKLSVNTNTKTYVFNANGLQPDTTYYLNDDKGAGTLGSAKANERGDVHLQGEWKWNFPDVTASPKPTFQLSLESLPGIDLARSSKLTAKAYTTLLWTHCKGKLMGETAYGSRVYSVPLPNQRVNWYYMPDGYTEVVYDHATTDSNGEYAMTHAFTKFGLGWVKYAGGWANGVLYEPTQVYPDWLIN